MVTSSISGFISGNIFNVGVDQLSCLPVVAYKAILMLVG